MKRTIARLAATLAVATATIAFAASTASADTDINVAVNVVSVAAAGSVEATGVTVPPCTVLDLSIMNLLAAKCTIAP